MKLHAFAAGRSAAMRPLLCSLLTALSVFAVHCGGPAAGQAPVTAATPAATSTSKQAEPRAKRGHLLRGDVMRATDGSVGSFLQAGELQVAAEVRAGKFVGWRIAARGTGGLWTDIDIQVGDVVKRVNGLALERPEDADAALRASKSRPAIDVLLERDSKEVQLQILVDD